MHFSDEQNKILEASGFKDDEVSKRPTNLTKMNKNFSIQKLQKIFVTNNSVIIKQGAVLKDFCVAEEHFKKYQKLKFRLKYFFPIFSFAKKPHILITDEWSKNYCHWLWEALSKLIDLKREFPDAILVLPKSYLKIDFVMKSLAAFGFNNSNIKTIPKKSQLFLNNVAAIPCINIATPGYYDYLKFNEVGQTLVSHYQNQLKTNFGERIYISRNRPDKEVPRRVNNEKELVAMLAKYGFKTVYMENFSFLEQISIASFARFIVASHGAGITNCMFAKKPTHLFELINESWKGTCFEKMCKKAEITYSRIDCKQSDNGTIHLGNITVDVAKLEQKISEFLK